MRPNKKTVALLSTSALAAGAAHGSILYTPVNVTLAANAALALDLNQDGAPDFQIEFSANSAAKPFVVNTTSGPASSFVLSAAPNNGLPVTAPGTLINGGYESAQASGYFNKETVSSSVLTVGGWTAAGNIDGYVGLELIDGAGTHYGWAHFIYNAAGAPLNDKDSGALTLVDAAMETSPGVGILAGQTAEPATQPAVVAPPTAQTGYAGGTAQLTVIATGNPAPSFQWQSGAVGSGLYQNVALGAPITASVSSDGTTGTLTLGNLTAANTADYVVVVSNASGSVTSPSPATLTVLPMSDTPATLVHRYSFQDAAGSPTFSDSVGGPSWNGALMGSATLTGSNLVLDGSANCYAFLPPYITANYPQMTVEFWADIGTNPPYTRVFAFGDPSGGQENSGFDYSPYENGGYQNLNFTNTVMNEVYANNNVALTNTTGNHITAVVDAVNGALYYYNGTNVVSTLHDNGLSINATLLASSSGTPLSLADINDYDNLIGASLVAVDPCLAGTIHEFRIYQGVLPPQAVALNDAVGPANYIELSANPALSASVGGGNIILSWPASDYNFAVQSRSGLGSGTGWTTLTNAPALVGTNWRTSVPSTGAAQFFQLVYK